MQYHAIASNYDSSSRLKYSCLDVGGEAGKTPSTFPVPVAFTLQVLFTVQIQPALIFISLQIIPKSVSEYRSLEIKT